MRLSPFFLFYLFYIVTTSDCCTGILLKTTHKNPIYARTLEFGQNLESHILTVPRNYSYKAPTPNSKFAGLQWSTKYAAIGANAFKEPYFIDGVNEAGLAGGLFYFPGFASYQEVKTENYARSLPFWSLLTWILTNCATVQEVKNALPTIYISKTDFPAMHQDPPAHIIIHDLSGKSLVIEYINGVLQMHDNPLGVITNSPNFDWHITNLRNYINLSPLNAPDKILNGVTFSQLGQGSGMLGLPGDFTPPSRFVRAVWFTQSAPKLHSELDAINHAFHILNNFDIPKGAIVDKHGVSDYTTWTSAIDMKNKIFYYKTYENQHVQKATLDAAALTTKNITMIPMSLKEF